MPVTLVASDEARVTVTPNAAMTTLASPTHGGASSVTLWKVRMDAGQQGPLHSFDTEQAWHVLEGHAEVACGELVTAIGSGDTVVLPAGVPRRIHATTDVTFVVSAPTGGLATPLTGDPTPVAPPWLA